MSGPLFNTWANVPNIATLRSLGGLTLCDQAADVVNVIGYYTSSVTGTPDGGGGTFVYNPSDTTTVDNGGTIIVDTVGRRWYRQFDGTRIDVRWFGAKGDNNGSIGNGTDDTAAIQAAIYFVDLAWQGLQFPVIGTLLSLYFPAGNYRITATINTVFAGVNRGSINWIGDGKDSSFYHRSVLVFDHTSTVCINVNEPAQITLYGTIKDMAFVALHQTTLQHCFSMVAGFSFIEGAMERLSFIGFTGAAIWFPAGTAAYMQQVRFDDISTSNIGGFIGMDASLTFANNVCNVCLIRNFNLDDSVNLSIATQPAFFNLLGFGEVIMEQIIYEGAGSTPAIIKYGGNTYFRLKGFHVEITAPYPTNFIELTDTITNNGTLIDINGVQFINVLSGTVIKFDNRANTTIRITDFSIGGAQISDVTDFAGAGTGVHVELNSFTTNQVPYLTTNEISKINFNNIRTISGSSEFITDSSVAPYVSERGIWLDGYQDGIVSIAAGGLSPPTNFGMFTDADEGRCFEIVGDNNSYPQIIITVKPPAALVGQQMVFAARCYLDSAQTPYDYVFLLPNVAAEAHHNQAQLTQNAWVTEASYCLVPSTTPFTVSGNDFSIISPTGVKKLRIASIYVAAGTEVPLTLIGGGLATKPITWSATAAPTYGAYIVGDKVTNSVPAVGQPLGWVCTVAGSPGTWVALANL